MGFLEVLLDSGKSGVLNVVVGEGGREGARDLNEVPACH